MAIKISGSTIIDDSRVVVNADKIGIGAASPNFDLEILSSGATGIAVSATNTQNTDTNKALRVFNNSGTVNFGVSYKGRVDAEEYYGTFKGNIDPNVPITNAGKIQIHHNSTNDFFNVPFFNRGLTNDTFQDIQYDNTNSLEYNPSLGNLRVTSGAGITGLILRTSNNTFDRAIAFQNSGNNYTGYIGMANIGGDDTDMVFGVDFTNESVATNVTERLRITNAGITSVKGEDDQDNFIVDVSGTQFAVHTDASDGEISLRAQDGTPNNNAKFMTFYTQESGSAAGEKLRITTTGNVGIGTDDPSSKFHIHSSQPRLTMSDSDTGAHHRINADSGAGNFAFDVDYSSTTSTPSFIVNIKGDEKFRVTSAGDVGIGTFNPTAPLHILRRVADTDGVTTLLTLHSTRNDMNPSYVAGGSLRFLNDDGNNSAEAFIQANVPSAYNPASEANRERTVDFNFIQENAGTLNTNFTIKGQGNVGINQSDPQTLLDIHTTTQGEVVRLRASDNARYLKISTFNAEFNGSGYDFNATSSGGALRFSINSGEKLRITKDGDLLRGGTGQDIGSASAPWDKVYANEFIGEINTTQENITTGDLLVTGIATFQGNVSIAGTLTYEDVTNVDAIGLVTARNGIHVTGGSVGIGTDNPLSLLSLYSDAADTELLHFDMGSVADRRGWRFEQKDTGTATKLNLKSASNGKSFLVSDSSDNVTLQVHTSSTGGVANNGAYIFMYPFVGIGQTLAHIGDTDTKLEFPADNTIKFDTAGTERLRIESGGDVGIGTNNALARLDVYKGTSATDVDIFSVRSKTGAFNIQCSDTDASNPEWRLRTYSNEDIVFSPGGTGSSAEKLRIDSNGRILIGHSSTPTSALSVAVVGSYGGSSNLTPFVYLCRDETISDAIGANESLGQILFASKDGYRGAVIESRAAGVWSSSSSDGYLVFKTTPDNSIVPAERLRITSDGNVGIKNDSPASQLDGAKDLVIGNTSEADSGITLVSTTAGQGLIHFSDATSGNARYDGFIGYEQTDRFLKFGTAQSLRLKIDSDGNLLRGGTGQDIGESSAPWDKVYANEFIGLVNTTQENITTGNLLVTGISTFVGVATFHAVGIGTNSVDSAKLEINVGSAVTALDIQGSEGQLFSVTNNLTTGSIFAVNDVSGTPSINVDADGTIQLAPFLASDKIGIGTTNPAHKLDVIGDALVNGTLFLDDTVTSIEKITGAAGYIDLYADSAIRLYESDDDRLGITFDVNRTATDRDVRIFFMGESTTYLHSPAVNTLGFKINNNDTLRLADSKVGVNVTDPHCALDVRNASGTDPLVELHHSSYDVLGEVIRIGRTDDDAIRYHSIKAKHHATANANQLQIFMHDGTGSPAIGQTEAVRIRGDGKIGIGTDNITQRLVVEDSLQLRSALYNTILFFQRTDTNANGWIGIPNWNPDALYIFGPTSNSNEVAAAYGGAKWTFSTGGNTALTIKDGGSVNIGGDYDQTTRKLKVTGDVEVASGTLYANISGTITPSGDVDISGDLTVSGSIGIGTDNANRPLDVFGNASIGTKSTADAELIIGRGNSGNRNAYIDFIGDNTYSDYGLRMIRKNNGANAESQIAHRGTGNLSILAQEAADIVLSTSNTNRVHIKSDGKIGIGTVSPILITADDEEAIQITADIRNSNADDIYALRIDIDDDDDAVNVNGDRARGSAYFRFDGNSDQGDTSDELQIYNIFSDVNVNKDYDLVRGVYSDVSTHHSAGGGTISNSFAVYGDNKHEDDGAISNVYGALFYGRANGTGATGTISTLYGLRAIARHAGDNTGNTGTMIGVRGEVQIRENVQTRRTAGNVYSFYADLHNDNIDTPSTVVTGRKAMYFGDVSGTTNVNGLGRIYGLYLQDVTDNYLAGNLQVVGVATVATLNATTINATTITGTVSGAAERITLTNQSGDDTCNIVFAQSATGNQLPHTNANLTFNATTGQVGASLLRVTGGTFANTGAGAETNPTNVAMMVDKGDYIYTHDSTAIKRRLLGKTNGNIIELGHSNTAHIGEIRMLPGQGFFSVYQGSNEKLRVQSDALNFKTPIRYGSDTSTLLTSHVYVRGTAHNNSGVEASRVVRLNGEDIIPNDSTGIGLVLVVLNAGSGISTSSITRYNTHSGGDTPANNMATKISDMTRDQIGIIASYDACMNDVTDNLRTAAQKVGLFKLAGISGHTGGNSRLGYAAVFRGTSNDTSAEVNDAIEVVQAYSANAGPPTAVITTHLASFGTSGRDAGITGAYSVSSIVAPSGSYEPLLLQGKSTSPTVSHLSIGAGVHLLPSGSASNDTDSNGVDLGGGSNYLRQIYVRKLNADSIVGGLAPTGNVDISGNLDVDGQTDLDVLNVAELATFTDDIRVDVIRGRSHFSNSFLDFDDDSVPPHMTGSNVTSLKSISGLNLVFDTNNNDNNGLTIGSGNATSADMNVHMVVTAAGDVGIGTISPTGGNALTNNTSTLAVGTLKANTISGTVSNSTNATNADHVKVTDNENTNETNLITFVENAQDTTGNHGLEMDGNLTYNPAYGRLGATVFQGSGAGLENLAVTAIDLDGGTATTSLANDDLFLVRDDDASTLTGSDGKNRKVTFQTLSNAISSSIGGVTDVVVTQENRSAPCYLPITVTGTSTKTIGIATESNAFGAKYVQATEPTGSSICDGDLWYDTSGEEQDDAGDSNEIVEATKFFQNSTSLTQTTTFPTSGVRNGGVFGPYTIAGGVTFTINSGSTFTIL